MTNAYIPTLKDANTMKHSTTCDTCGKTVTSVSAGGLRPAMRRHLAKHHPAIYSATAKFSVTPKVIQLPENRAVERPSVECPYCHITLSSVRANLLPGILTRHKRNEHEELFIDEIAARNRCILDAVQAEELVEVRVKETYYPRAFLVTRYPKLTTVMVPARWRVDAVYVLCDGSGRYTAYRGRMGASEAWGVGK